jgi:branched-chain amino acid aminotransferase
MAFSITRNPNPRSAEEREAIVANPVFGTVFTDHMVVVDYADGQWGEGRVVPYGPLTLDPATTVLHYGQEIFEGLKAYAQPDGSVATFRADANARRFQRSAHRMGMAELPQALFIESLKELVSIDKAWVPTGESESLYIRPFMIATEVGLGVNKPSSTYSYIVFAGPAGPYFSGGVKPVKVWLSTDFVRAAPGGTGEAKCGGNYAASFLAQQQAVEQGCDQVVWLDAIEHRWVEEMGGMNMYFVHGSGASARVVTPALSGSLLPGVTRDSLLTIATDLGYSAEEGKISTDEWKGGVESGQITEVFACGTAAAITPIGSVKSAGGEFTIADGNPGPITLQLRETLLGIQSGTVADEHNWMNEIA